MEGLALAAEVEDSVVVVARVLLHQVQVSLEGEKEGLFVLACFLMSLVV